MTAKHYEHYLQCKGEFHFNKDCAVITSANTINGRCIYNSTTVGEGRDNLFSVAVTNTRGQSWCSPAEGVEGGQHIAIRFPCTKLLTVVDAMSLHGIQSCSEDTQGQTFQADSSSVTSSTGLPSSWISWVVNRAVWGFGSQLWCYECGYEYLGSFPNICMATDMGEIDFVNLTEKRKCTEQIDLPRLGDIWSKSLKRQSKLIPSFILSIIDFLENVIDIDWAMYALYLEIDWESHTFFHNWGFTMLFEFELVFGNKTCSVLPEIVIFHTADCNQLRYQSKDQKNKHKKHCNWNPAAGSQGS